MGTNRKDQIALLRGGFNPSRQVSSRSLRVLVSPISILPTNLCHFDYAYSSLFLHRERDEDILNFWLDVQQHENLCRAYFRDVRKFGRTIKEDWPEYWDCARRRGSIYGTVVDNDPQTATERGTTSTSQPLAEEDSQNVIENPSPRMASATPATVTGDEDGQQQPHSSTISLSGRAPTTILIITRKDLITSAERIFRRYLFPGNTENHNIYIPPELLIPSVLLAGGGGPKFREEGYLVAQVPDLFHAQKEYCFTVMEQDAFPRFLRSRIPGSFIPLSPLGRVIVQRRITAVRELFSALGPREVQGVKSGD